MNYLKIARSLVIPVVASLSAVAVISLQLPKLNAQQQQSDKAEYLKQEEAEKLRLSLSEKMPSFGFNNLIAGWEFLNFTQYFGDNPAREQIGYSLVPEYFKIIVQRDPRFINAYFYLSPATTLFAGRPDRSVALMEQGLNSISPNTAPKAYLLWNYKGVDELLFLGDHKAARRSYEMAAKSASTFTDPSSQAVATRARETARFLAKNPQSTQARIGAWAMLLSNALDNSSRQLAINNIRKLGGEVTVTPDGVLQIKSPAEK